MYDPITQAVITVVRDGLKLSPMLLLAALGEIYTERSGILNLGLEGLMSLGAAIAYVYAFYGGNPYLAIVVGGAVAAVFGLVHAFISVNLKGNQILSGLAITISGVALSLLIGAAVVGKPVKMRIPEVIPAAITGNPIADVLSGQTVFTFIAWALAIVLWVILFKTKLGFAIRFSGENPLMVDALGYDVIKIRYGATIFGAFMAGVAGGFYVLGYLPMWLETMEGSLIRGRGFIVIALVIVSLWNPLIAIATSTLFASLERIPYALQSLIIGIPSSVAYFFNIIPYAVTIAILVIINSTKLRKILGVPSQLAVPYSRE